MPSVDYIKQNYEGYRGWNDEQSIINDFNATGGAGKGGLGSVNVSKPTINLSDVYTKALTDSGVQQYQSEADAIQGNIDQRRQALTIATTGINDNPFYSEATRVGRVSKLNDIAQQDIGNFVNQQSVAQNKVSTAKADAQVKLNIATQQYNIESQDYQQQVQTFNNLLTSGGLNGLDPAEYGNIAQIIGIPVSAVKSVIEQSKAKSDVPPQIMTVDDGVNQKVVALDSKGNIVNESVLGPSVKAINAPATTGGGSTAKAPNTAKFLNPSIKILGEADISYTGKGTEDKLLSRAEQEQAYSRILALVGGDEATAQQVFTQAFNTGGYGNYGN